MGSWGALFSALAGPLAKRVLIALGLGLITFGGLSALQGQVASAISGAWSGVPAGAYQILALSGCVDAVNVWLAALATVAASMAIKRYGVVTA